MANLSIYDRTGSEVGTYEIDTQLLAKQINKQLLHDVVVMYLGRVVERAPVDDVFHDPKHPYTRALLRSERNRGCFIHSESLLAVDAGTDAKADGGLTGGQR